MEAARAEVLDPRQLSRIEATHRGFLYQHLFAAGCLLKGAPAGIQTVIVEHDEDLELIAGDRHLYAQIKTRSGTLYEADLEGFFERAKQIAEAHANHTRPGAADIWLITNAPLSEGSLLPRKWADVHNLDGDLPFIMVPLTKNGEPKAALLSDEAVESLKKLPSYGASDYLFPAKPNPRFKGDFKRPYAWDLGKRFRRVCRLIGIRSGTIGEVGPRIHDWRHFSASVLLGQGVPDNVIAKHTGHKSKELERYKHLFPELRQQTVQLIDKEVKIPKKKT
jgi:integrase